MRWTPLLPILLLLPGCAADVAPHPHRSETAVEAERGAVPDHRGTLEVAGQCTLTWASERLELACPEQAREVLATLVGRPAVSADGTRIAVSLGPDDDPRSRVVALEFAEGRWLEPRVLVRSEGRPDRVAVDPEGTRVVYVDAADGIAALWLVPFEGGEPRPLTNAGLADAPREPGQPPTGFVPVPLREPPVFEGDRLVWTSAAGRHELELP